MPTTAALLLFAGASLALLVVPGPAVAFVVTRSVVQGRSAGLVSVLGLHTGSLVHVAAAALGLSALLVSSAVAFTIVKYAGAAYLIVLGVRKLLSRAARTDELPPPVPNGRLFRQGFVVELLNPKTAIFFLAFLPQFVNPRGGPAWLQLVMLGLIFCVLGLLSDGSYAVAAGSLGRRFRESARVRLVLDRISGAVYVVLGTIAALTRSPAH